MHTRKIRIFKTEKNMKKILTITIEIDCDCDCETPDPPLPDPPLPDPPTPGEWNAYFPNASVSAQSGGYGAFSSDSKHIAIKLPGRKWSIRGIDGSERAVDHLTGGSSLGDFMWASEGNKYFWINSQMLQLFSLDGQQLNAWSLATSDGAIVQWRSGAGSNRAKQFVIGSQEMGPDIYHTYMQSITVNGPDEGFWVRDLPGRDEYRFHNVYSRNGGYGGSLSGSDQGIEWITNYTGTELRQVPEPADERMHSHESWEGDETLFFYSRNDSVRLMKFTPFDSEVITDITQSQLKDVLGTTNFVAGGHTDLRGAGALISVVDYDLTIPAEQRIWSVLYWDRTELHLVYTGVQFDNSNFHNNLLPTMSPDNRYAAFHDQGGVRIVDMT